jgi:dihydrofolate synthase / folylpolyglutamate synthase
MFDMREERFAAYQEIVRALLQRTPESKISPTLDRVADLVELLGSPQHNFRVIHVAGTNGKTSTARMIESLLRSFGIRTGLFTSPHLTDLRERICLDGEPISMKRFFAAAAELDPYLAVIDERLTADGESPLGFFEVMTALAFVAFADTPIDVAVVEVGMGGRWDATNVVAPEVVVITPISIDHAEYLGGTLAEIAAEKAGTIKAGVSLVVAPQEPSAAQVIEEAAAMAAATVWYGADFGVERQIAVGGQVLEIFGAGGQYEDVFLPLYGAHQGVNAAVAVAAVELFLGGGRALNSENIRSALASVASPGRLEVVRRTPTVIVDAAHNPGGAAALAAAVAESFAFSRLAGVVGVLADKDARGILAELEPILDVVVLTKSGSPRSLDPVELLPIAVEIFGVDRVRVAERLDDALAAAIADSEAGADLGTAGVLVTGSITLVGEARLLLGAESH